MNTSFDWLKVEGEFNDITGKKLPHFQNSGDDAVLVGKSHVSLDNIPKLAIEIFQAYSGDLEYRVLCIKSLEKIVSATPKTTENNEKLNKCRQALGALLTLGEAEAYLDDCRERSEKIKIPLPDAVIELNQKVSEIHQVWISDIESEKNINTSNFKYLDDIPGCIFKEYQEITSKDISLLSNKDQRIVKMRSLFLDALFNKPQASSQKSTALHYAVANKDQQWIRNIFELARIQGKEIASLCLEIDEDGLNPVHVALFVKNDDFLEQLLHFGININTLCNKGGTPLLHAAIRMDQALWLLDRPQIDPTITDYHGRTALHIAAESGNIEIVQKLLALPKGQECLSIQDHSHYTPLDLALMSKQDQIIALLDPAIHDPITHPLYGKPFIAINQGIIIKQFERYLEVQGRKVSDTLLNKAGQCNGLSFLHNYYTAMGKEDEFFKVLETIVLWNGSEESLRDSEIVRSFEGHYKNLEDLFEQWMNDIFFAQSPGKILPGISQSDRVGQYSISRPKDQKIDVASQTEVQTFHGDLKTLTNLFLLLQNYRKGWCFNVSTPPLASEGHTTSCTIDLEGKFHFYDPTGLSRQTPTEDPRICAKIIQDMLFSLYSISSYSPSKDEPQAFNLNGYLIGTPDEIQKRQDAAHQIDPNQFHTFAKEIGFPAELSEYLWVALNSSLHV